jgi:hypothetical protein
MTPGFAATRTVDLRMPVILSLLTVRLSNLSDTVAGTRANYLVTYTSEPLKIKLTHASLTHMRRKSPGCDRYGLRLRLHSNAMNGNAAPFA